MTMTRKIVIAVLVITTAFHMTTAFAYYVAVCPVLDFIFGNRAIDLVRMPRNPMLLSSVVGSLPVTIFLAVTILAWHG